jgi:hypothetical protein
VRPQDDGAGATRKSQKRSGSDESSIVSNAIAGSGVQNQ